MGEALDLALLLARKATTEFFLDDGSYDAERFGGHTHSTTCVMSSLAQLADLTNDSVLLERVRKFYDNGLWEIRDEIGWVVEVGGPQSEVDCLRGETNNSGDILETALILGARGHAQYFADAERIIRAHLLPSQLRDVSFICSAAPPADGSPAPDGEIDAAERLRGSWGFPAQHGHIPERLWQGAKPRIGFNPDIVGGTTASLVAAVEALSSFDASRHSVNLWFDHETEHLCLRSPYTHPSLQVKLKTEGALFVRMPPWLPEQQLRVEAGVLPSVYNPASKSLHGIGAPRRLGDWLVLPCPPTDEWITILFELPVFEQELTWRGRSVRSRFRGDEVIAMENFNEKLAFFPPL